MRFVDLAVWAPGWGLELVVGFAILSLILCGLTTVFIAGFYLICVARGYLTGRGLSSTISGCSRR
jgi:hypothetical protein